MSGPPIYVDPLCGQRFGSGKEGLALLIEHRKECKIDVSEKTFLCNQCGRWNPDGAYVPDEGGLLWVGVECLTDDEKAEFYETPVR